MARRYEFYVRVARTIVLVELLVSLGLHVFALLLLLHVSYTVSYKFSVS